MTVELFSKPGCQGCNATARALDKLHLDYTKTDVSIDPIAMQRIVDLGYTGVPVVVVDGEREHWSGFRPDRIKALTA